MNHMQKIVVAAVTGALASSVIALGRNIIRPVKNHFARRKQRAELDAWYGKELRLADAFATGLTPRFVEMHQQEALGILDPDVRFDPQNIFPLQPFAERVDNYIWMYREAEITRECSIRLQEIDPKLAHEHGLLAAELEKERGYEAAQMQRAGYPMSKLHNWIKNFA